MARRQHRTMRGLTFDMEAFTRTREETVAVGNMNANAKGDILKDGKIVQKRDDVVRDYYREELPTVEKISLKDTKTTQPEVIQEPIVFENPEEAIARLQNEQKLNKPAEEVVNEVKKTKITGKKKSNDNTKIKTR